MEKDTKRLNVVMDNDLHIQMKIELAKKETTISKYICEAVREKIEREKGAEQ